MSEEYDFSDIPNDIYLNNIWKNLPVKHIIALCASNKFMADICQNNNTWIYLLKRDYDKKYNGHDAYQQYVSLTNYFRLLEEINFDPAQGVNYYTIRHLRWISNFLLIDGRSRMNKNQLFDAIIFALKYRYPDLHLSYLL